MRFKLFATALWCVYLAGPVAAQPIDMAPICAAYAGRTLYTKDSRPVAMTCEQLTAFGNKLNLKESLTRTTMPELLSLGKINLDDFESGIATGRMHCSRSTLPSGRFALRCTLKMDKFELLADASADDEGYVTEVAYLMADFRGPLKPLARHFQVEPEDLTDEFHQFVLDVVVAKDASFGDTSVVIERVGVGLRFRLQNIPRSAVPRIRKG
jgi:hypothetical protein